MATISSSTASSSTGSTTSRRWIDVRQPSEFASGHIEGSELVPLGSLAKASTLWDRNQPITVVCRSGHRAERARAELTARRFTNVTVLPGGVLRWSAEGKRLVVPGGADAPKMAGAKLAPALAILLTLALAYYVSPWFLLATAIVAMRLVSPGCVGGSCGLPGSALNNLSNKEKQL